MDCAIELRNVTGGPTLQAFSLRVAPGETVLIAGPRGTGKHLILSLILGLRLPERGIVRLLGRDLGLLSIYERRTLRMRCSLVPVSGALLSNLSVFDNVALPLRYHSTLPESEVHKRVRSVLETQGLGDLAGRRPSDLAVAQHRLVSIARARAVRPEVLLLEDPYEGMDDAASDQISALVAEVAGRGCATVLTTHGTRLATIYDGRLLRLPKARVIKREVEA